MSEPTTESDVELCRRCGERPGRERFYVPGEPGKINFSLPGQQLKFSAKRTIGCDPCWQEFLELRGVPVRPCCGLRHEGAECPDGLVTCQLCFERRSLDELHVTEEGDREDVCAACADHEACELERRALAAVEALPPEAHVYGAPWPPARGWRTVVKPGWTALTGHLRGHEWLPWVLVWLVGCALVVTGGGLDGVVAGVGLVATGAGGGLFVRWLWERLS